jgi:chromosome segregation ATPase
MKTVAFVLALCVASAAATLRGAKPKTPAAALVGAVSDLNRVGSSIQSAFSNVQDDIASEKADYSAQLSNAHTENARQKTVQSKLLRDIEDAQAANKAQLETNKRNEERNNQELVKRQEELNKIAKENKEIEGKLEKAIKAVNAAWAIQDKIMKQIWDLEKAIKACKMSNGKEKKRLEDLLSKAKQDTERYSKEREAKEKEIVAMRTTMAANTVKLGKIKDTISTNAAEYKKQRHAMKAELDDITTDLIGAFDKVKKYEKRLGGDGSAEIQKIKKKVTSFIELAEAPDADAMQAISNAHCGILCKDHQLLDAVVKQADKRFTIIKKAFNHICEALEAQRTRMGQQVSVAEEAIEEFKKSNAKLEQKLIKVKKTLEGLIKTADRIERDFKAEAVCMENRKNKLNKARASLDSELSYNKILKNIIDNAIKEFQAAVAQNEKDLAACKCTSKFDALKKAVADQETKIEVERVARDMAITDLTQKAAENEQIENEIQTSTAQIATDRENFKNTMDKDRELIQTRKAMTEEADKSSKRMLEEIKKKPDIEIDMTDNEAKLAALLGR